MTPHIFHQPRLLLYEATTPTCIPGRHYGKTVSNKKGDSVVRAIQRQTRLWCWRTEHLIQMLSAEGFIWRLITRQEYYKGNLDLDGWLGELDPAVRGKLISSHYVFFLMLHLHLTMVCLSSWLLVPVCLLCWTMSPCEKAGSHLLLYPYSAWDCMEEGSVLCASPSARHTHPLTPNSHKKPMKKGVVVFAF